MLSEVSLCITTYNDEKEIYSLLNDIDSQSLLPKEIVFADGGSTDSTVDILKEYKEHSLIPVKILSGKRLNISQGLNTAIRSSIGTYILIMATGNSYKPDFIEILYKNLKENKVDICYPPLICHKNNTFSKLYDKYLMNDGRGTRYPSNHGILINKNVYKRIGLYYEYFIYAGEDAEFNKRISDCGKYKLSCVDDTHVEWNPPNTLKNFNRQIKAYTIAKMQIETLPKIIWDYKYFFIFILSFVLVFFGVINRDLKTSIIAFMIMLLTLFKKSNISSLFNWMRFYQDCYSLFVIIFNLKYASKSYHVDRRKISYLL